MKMALVHPPREPVGNSKEFYFPLGLGYIAAVLEQHKKNFYVIDLAGEDNFERRFRRELEAEKPDIVGISCLIGAGLSESLRLLLVSKEYDCQTLIGGPMPSALPNEFLDKGADMVCVGEGEITVLELMSDIKFPSRIITSTPPDVTKLPLPARHLFDMRKYSPHIQEWDNRRLGTILTSRGCPFGCKFCYRSLFKYKWRARTAEDVLKEIETLVEEYGNTGIYFADDQFILDKERVVNICKGIIYKRYDLCWTCGARVDLVNEETLKWMHRAGCREIFFGIESGSQRMLDLMKKGTTIKQAERAIKMAEKTGIVPIGAIMVGTPHEREEDLMKTIEFIKRNPITYDIAYYSPRPESEWSKYALSKGIKFNIDDWADYSRRDFRPHFNLTDMPLERLYELVDEMKEIAKTCGVRHRIMAFLRREKLNVFSLNNTHLISNFLHSYVKNFLYRKRRKYSKT